jgi:outer membrane protein assembly factor BamA
MEYGRRRLALTGSARVELGRGFFTRLAGEYSRIRTDIPPGGLLAQQRESGPDAVRALLDGPTSYGVAWGELWLEYDTRDDEIVTRTGAYHHLRVRASPRLGPGQPYRYGEANVTLRLYRAPLRWLRVGGRLLVDLLVGHPPLHELTRIQDNSVVGGGRGVRGVPGQRYYGKAKVLGNLEVRAELWHGTRRGKPFALAAAGFLDGGRVWAELRPSPELDGRGLGLKYGVGGGLRLQQGHTFVVRVDLAWSPDAEPIATYFAAGEMF